MARAVTQGEWGVGTHWQLLNFSKQLGTASQVWVVATAVNGGGGGGVVRVVRARRGVGALVASQCLNTL